MERKIFCQVAVYRETPKKWLHIVSSVKRALKNIFVKNFFFFSLHCLPPTFLLFIPFQITNIKIYQSYFTVFSKQTQHTRFTSVAG